MNHLRPWLAGCVLMLGLAPAIPTQAARPAAPQLLPESTVVYVRVHDMRDLRQRFSTTSLGRILNDEEVQPLVQHLYGSAVDAFKVIQDRVGKSLDELLELPQGEVCLALVLPEEGVPALVGFVEVGRNEKTARDLFSQLELQLTSGGASVRSEEYGGTMLNTISSIGGGGNRQLTHCVKDRVVLFSSNVDLAREILDVWNGNSGVDTLADKRRFASLMRRCAGTKDERPQLTFYADPIALFKHLAKGNMSMSVAQAMLPSLGLDGLKAVGGSAIFSTEQLDAVYHVHVTLATPRQSILAMVALKTGDTTPETWVPSDVASYSTFYWDFDKTYLELTETYDAIRGPGELGRVIDDYVNARLGISFEQELLAHLNGRVSFGNWIERPIKVDAAATFVAFQVKEGKSLRSTIKTVTDKLPLQFERKSFSGTTFYQAPRQPRRRRPGVPADLMRDPEACVAIVSDYLILTDSSKLMKHLIKTQQGNQRKLAGDLDFKLVSSKIRRLDGGKVPCLITFERPEDSLRALYEMAQSNELRGRMSELSEENRLLRVFDDALNDNPLPPFSTIEKYLAPGGALLTDESTGLHYTGFTLRRD